MANNSRWQSLRTKHRARGALARALGACLFLGAVIASGCGDSDESGFGAGPFAGHPPCERDGQCAPPLPYCHAGAHVCVQCLSDGNCGDGSPYCDQQRGQCVDCLKDADCGDPRLACQPATGECRRRCASNVDCDSERPYCSGGLCVECASDGNCGGDQPYCDVARGQCIECLGSGNCGGGQPYCDPVRGRCVQCMTNADCTTGETCHPTELECVSG